MTNPRGIGALRAVGKLGRFFLPQWRTALAGTFFLLLSSAATVLTPRIMGAFVDALNAKETAAVYRTIALFAGNELLRVVASGLSGLLLTITGQKTLHQLRVAIMDHLFRLRIAEVNERTPGGLVSHITTDVGALTDLFSTGFVESVEKIVIVAGITVSILSLNLKLGAILLSAFLILFIVAAFLTRVLHRFYKKLRAASGEMQRIMAETLLGTPSIRLFNLYAEREELLRQASESYASALLRPAWGFAVFHPVVTLVNGTSMALLIWVGGAMALGGEITFGTLVAMSAYILWLFWPIMHIVDRWNVLLSGSAAAQRIFDLLSVPPEDQESASVHLPRPLSGAVRFDSVGFGYVPHTPVFSSLSFDVSPGQRVAIVGATGSGKTTIVNLLLRLWEVSIGSIRLDSTDAAGCALTELRKRFGLIEQELYLFSGTIGDNITLWDENPESARLQSLREKLPQLPAYERSAQERGSNLSMGERQLVSLARALYSKPEILILDEATAHLDPLLDRQLQLAMRELAGGATTFVIAHRLSSITDADKILVLHHGVLVESGTHDELLSLQGIYAKLFAIERQEQRFSDHEN